MKHILKIFLVISLSLVALKASNFNQKTYQKKSDEYYKEYKREFDKLPIENKKRILDAYYTGLAYDMGYTLAGTRFLENRGMDTRFSNKESINKNVHKQGYVTFDCGDYGINTMTYLKSIGKKTTNLQAHKQACKKLADDRQLNLNMSLKVYNYGLEKFKTTLLSWNYYNTGRKNIINDRVYQMKGIIMVIEDEVKKNKIQDYRLALNDKKYNNYK